MKISKICKFLCVGLSLLAFIACDTPSNSNSSVTVVSNPSSTDEIPSADTSGNTDTDDERAKNEAEEGENSGGDSTDTVDVDLPDDYIRGFDVSAVDYWEKDYAVANDWAGEKWYDTDGSEKDFYEILAAHGINTARIRVWVDPSADNTSSIITDSYWPASTDVENAWRDGDNTTERAIAMAKRAKAAGLKVMLDLHYSDYWTDPGKQVIPAAWQSVTNAETMKEKISEYTTNVLTEMKNAEVTPDYVQVGNEIDSGILLHTKYNSSSGATAANDTISGKLDGSNFAAYIKAGCDAVREFDSAIKVILHVTNRKPVSVMQKLTSVTNYDIIALSYYPWESSHGTVESLKNNIESLKSTYSKPVIIGEISAHWNYTANSYDSDLAMAAAHLIDPDTNMVFSDIETETVSNNGSNELIVKGSVENQTAIFRHVIEESVASGASGIVAWGGERRADWKYAFFDWNGKVFSSIDVFNVKSASD
ncbi:MAG: glycosyl hydrolase 53 family protein [Treponema sp.]|nr:glycosyl hydrolase 53 family protein [Treponema sp.]